MLLGDGFFFFLPAISAKKKSKSFFLNMALISNFFFCGRKRQSMQHLDLSRRH